MTTSVKSLNPYYTGIHLHTTLSEDGIVDFHCLNPYYTGIHLHNKYQCARKYRRKCLNPYYTGIHLHELKTRKKLTV